MIKHIKKAIKEAIKVGDASKVLLLTQALLNLKAIK